MDINPKVNASWLFQIDTNTESLTLHKLTALHTAQLFSGLTDGQHLRKVCTQSLAELKLDYHALLLFICSSLLVGFSLFLYMCLAVPIQKTPSFSPCSIILPTLPSITQLPVIIIICHQHINSPATYQRDLTQKAFQELRTENAFRRAMSNSAISFESN